MINNEINSNIENVSSVNPSTKDERENVVNKKKTSQPIELVDSDKIQSPEDEFLRETEKSTLDSMPKKQTLDEIIAKNLNQAVEQIFDFAQKSSDGSIIKKYASKLKEIIQNKQLILTDIPEEQVAGRAIKNEDNTDTILIDNHDSFSNFNPQKLLKTLLHELRHTMETDNLNSRAEEKEAEVSAGRLAEQITGEPQEDVDIEEWLDSGYKLYAEASPGTYNIPQNTGFSVWYKPEDVQMDEKENKLLIKSAPQEKMDGAIIEDYVEFGDKKDENGNPFPVSAKRVIKDSSGNIISTFDYGRYDYQKREFTNNTTIYLEQKKLEANSKNEKNMGLV